MANLADKIAPLLPRAEGNPRDGSGRHLMQKDGQRECALSLCHNALALAPTEAELVGQANRLSGDDDVRDAAYEAALRCVVRPDSRVLEIGTGTPLVVTCEMNPAVAEMATDLVARNGFADRVRVAICRAPT